jgi:outer membrane biosynthesis protein TonB
MRCSSCGASLIVEPPKPKSPDEAPPPRQDVREPEPPPQEPKPPPQEPEPPPQKPEPPPKKPEPSPAAEAARTDAASPAVRNRWIAAAFVAAGVLLLGWFSLAKAQLAFTSDGKLCYQVSRASRAELEPLGLKATADNQQHCVAPLPVPTSYQLVAYGWLGIPARSDRVVVSATPTPAPTQRPTAPPTPRPTRPPPTPAPTPKPMPKPASSAAPSQKPTTSPTQAPTPLAGPVRIGSFRVVRTLPRRVCVDYSVTDVTSISIKNETTGQAVYSQNFGAKEVKLAVNPACIFLKRGRGDEVFTYELLASGTHSQAAKTISVDPATPRRKQSPRS